MSKYRKPRTFWNMWSNWISEWLNIIHWWIPFVSSLPPCSFSMMKGVFEEFSDNLSRIQALLSTLNDSQSFFSRNFTKGKRNEMVRTSCVGYNHRRTDLVKLLWRKIGFKNMYMYMKNVHSFLLDISPEIEIRKRFLMLFTIELKYGMCGANFS